jgi:hypothetical protein
MRVATMRLIKRGCCDGLHEIKDNVPLGKIYYVDLDTAQEIVAFNMEYGVEFTTKMVRAIDGGWLPLDILEEVIVL